MPNPNDRPRIQVKIFLKLQALIPVRFYPSGIEAGIRDVMADLWYDMTEEERERIKEQMGFERERQQHTPSTRSA